MRAGITVGAVVISAGLVGLLMFSFKPLEQRNVDLPTTSTPTNRLAHRSGPGADAALEAAKPPPPRLPENDDGWHELDANERTRILLEAFEHALQRMQTDPGDAAARTEAESALTLLRAELGPTGRDRHRELERRLDALTEQPPTSRDRP